jgi:hypothetical protein
VWSRNALMNDSRAAVAWRHEQASHLMRTSSPSALLLTREKEGLRLASVGSAILLSSSLASAPPSSALRASASRASVRKRVSARRLMLFCLRRLRT